MSSGADEKDRAFFNFGNDAAMKSNFDYAIDMYLRACKLKPDNLIYRQALRGVERRKFQNDPAKVGRLVGAKTQGIKLKVRAAKAKKQWGHVLETCEEVFVQNPWDLGAAREAAEAAEQLGYHLLAQWYLESVQGQANDPDFFRYLAHVHKLNASWPKAIQAWERVKKLDPNDEIANREINALSASATIQRAGLNEAIDQRDAQAAGAAAQDLEDLKAPQLTPEQRALKEIQEAPARVGPYLQLAEHYKHRGQLEDAEKALSRGLKAIPGDETLQLAHAEVQIARLQGAVAMFTKKVKAVPEDPALKAKLDQYTKMLGDYEIKEFRRRLTLAPEDYALHHEVGLRLAKAGRHDEAIASFQQATKGPAVKTQALSHVGGSFEAKKAWKLAERAYGEALKLVDPADTPTFLHLQYRLGRVAEEQGNNTIAVDHYNEVAGIDYSYLDVAKRLQDLS